MKHILISLFLLTFLTAGCGPSAEQVATMNAAAWTPTILPTATGTPTSLPTSSPSPVPPSATPKPTTGLISGQASWESTGAPVAGVALMFETLDLGDEVTTDEQGNYSAEVKPGTSYFALKWTFAGKSETPCSSNPAVTLVGEWYASPVIALNAGTYVLIGSTVKEISVDAGEQVKLDIVFSCQ